MSETIAKIRPVAFSEQECIAAADEWGFNCGPGALCAILELKPAQLRPLMEDFERKHYTNPTLMFQVLKNAGAQYKVVYRQDEPGEWPMLVHGLARIQFSGPWTKPGVPMRARYRQTHWVAVRNSGTEIYDVNAMVCGGWISFSVWSLQLIPWLIRELVPNGDGGFWVTHGIEVHPNGALGERALPRGKS